MSSHPEGRPGRLSLWLGVALAVACAIYATWVRFGELDAWREAPDVHSPGGVPAMTTLDAYYPLRWARAALSGTFHPEADDALRRHQTLQRPVGASEYFPDDSELDWRPRREPKRLPGLSWALAVVAPFAGSVERAGLYLVPVLANLFLVPMFLYGWRVGHPAAALMGGLVATFSIAYYPRTSVGWVDTDCLNLLFPWTASLLILVMDRGQRRSTLLLLSAAVGVTLYLYFRWYERPAFPYLYWATLAAHLALQRVRPGLVALCVATCVVFSHPLQAGMGGANLALLASRYLFETNPVAAFSVAARWFPDVMQTVGELQHGNWMEAFSAILAQPSAAMVGTLAFAVLAAARWRRFVPLLPLLALAALALVRGPRFAMYLAPFAGMGLGALAEVAVRGFLGRSRTLSSPEGMPGDRQASGSGSPSAAALRDARWIVVCAGYAAVLAVFFVGLRPMTGAGQVGKPAVPAEIASALRELGERLPPGTPMWTWWDYGYAIPYLASLAVYHDGGGQFTPQTNVIASSLVAADGAALRNTALFVDRFGNEGIDRLAREASTREDLLARIGGEAELPGGGAGSPGGDRDVHVLFTSNMVGIIGTMRHVAGLPRRNDRGEPIQYEILACNALRADVLDCDGGFGIDLATGLFSDGRAVGRLVVVADGRVARTMDYPRDSRFVLQVLADSRGRIEVLRLPDEVYRSNFNRMFLLGQFDPSLFEEVYRRYPAVRVFRIRR